MREEMIMNQVKMREKTNSIQVKAYDKKERCWWEMDLIGAKTEISAESNKKIG